MPFTRKSEEVPDVFDELDNLRVEVAVLRDANTALTIARDQLLSERNDLRAALANYARHAPNLLSIIPSMRKKTMNKQPLGMATLRWHAA